MIACTQLQGHPFLLTGKQQLCIKKKKALQSTALSVQSGLSESPTIPIFTLSSSVDLSCHTHAKGVCVLDRVSDTCCATNVITFSRLQK